MTLTQSTISNLRRQQQHRHHVFDFDYVYLWFGRFSVVNCLIGRVALVMHFQQPKPNNVQFMQYQLVLTSGQTYGLQDGIDKSL